MSLVLGGLFRFFSGPCSLQYKDERLGWSGALLQTEAALIGDTSKNTNYPFNVRSSLEKNCSLELSKSCTVRRDREPQKQALVAAGEGPFCSCKGPNLTGLFIFSGGKDAQRVFEGRPLQSPADIIL